MFTRLLTWLKPTLTQETEETILLKRAIENDRIGGNVEIEENDIIIFDRSLAGIGPAGQLQKALINDYTQEAAEVTYVTKGTRKTRWIPTYAITSNLGTVYDQKDLEELGYTDPKPQKTPNTKPLVTGTYIKEQDNEFSLVEIEKVNGTYYIHDTDDSYTEELPPNHDLTLHEFSTPEEGNYILDPGLYINTNQQLYEVIPFQGTCWTRRIGENTLMQIDPQFALELNRIETDDEPTPSFYLIDNPSQPQDTDLGPTEGYDPSIEPYKTPEINPTDPI